VAGRRHGVALERRPREEPTACRRHLARVRQAHAASKRVVRGRRLCGVLRTAVRRMSKVCIGVSTTPSGCLHRGKGSGLEVQLKG
jgi:hypothetical protein